jgi:pSer/pThr/pTyr-binding forkhead associated (FHA) protein
MTVKLIERHGRRIISQIEIGDRDLIIGRDPQADYFLDNPQISRRHAMIQSTEDGDWVSDLGSSNGTRVNKERIEGPTLLEFGDIIDLGHGVQLSYEDVSALTAVIKIALPLVAVVALAIVGFILRPAATGDPTLDTATEIAGEGRDLFQAGDVAGAKRKVSNAVAYLSDRGYFEGKSTTEARAAAFVLLEERLGDSFELSQIYAVDVPLPVPELEAEPSALPLTRHGPCRLEEIAARDLGLCVRERAIRVLVELWQDPRNIPEEFYVAVEEQLRMLAGRRRDWVTESLARGEPYREMMETELEAAKVPKALRYLSMIESGYHREIRSKAGAVGLWQFIPTTARAYGLKVSGSVDERKDPRKATQAAARYLRDLAFEFGGDALLLAIASYNKGENGMRRALKKLDDPRLDRSYWALVERKLLPTETMEYVPRLVAAAVLGEAGIPPIEVVQQSE